MASTIGRTAGRFPDLTALVRWLELAPMGTTMPAAELLKILAPLTTADACTRPASPVTPPDVSPATIWREKIWSVPSETRLGVQELAQATGRSAHWVYRHTSEKSDLPRLPHKKLDGALVFIAGEIRTWLRDNEETIEAGREERAPLKLQTGGR